MGHTGTVLKDILAQLHPGDEVIQAAKDRREEALTVAATFPGVLRVFRSGSIAHGTANFDTDADCGVVLDRRSYPKLGPDGEGEGPDDVVQKMREHLRRDLVKLHPDLRTHLGKRAIRLEYSEAVRDDIDPPVEVIVALTRKDEPGLWIPDRDHDTWDASDPERHTELLLAEPASLRQTRALAVRLAKGENKLHDDPALCGLNIEALALESVESGVSLEEALARHWEHAGSELECGPTRDPAGVSAPMKPLIPRSDAAARQCRAARLMRQALDHDDDDDAVRGALSELFPAYVEAPANTKAALVGALRSGNDAFTAAGVTATVGPRLAKPARAYGGSFPR